MILGFVSDNKQWYKIGYSQLRKDFTLDDSSDPFIQEIYSKNVYYLTNSNNSQYVCMYVCILEIVILGR